jgi:glycosyltransferase involved in cell wall biosynthesis
MTLTCSSTFARPDLIDPAVRRRLQFLVHRGVRAADLVLCPSENVRDLVKEAFRLPEDRMAVSPMGVGDQFRPMDLECLRPLLKRQYGIDGPYFFYSGRWDPRKNITRTLEAFAIFKQQDHLGIKLVLSGKKGRAAQDAERVIARRRLQESILHLPDTLPDELPALYGGALALVYASQWEGFGMPIVEAMASGTPVVTSNLSAMPEVAGGAALLVNPDSIEEIAAAMRQMAQDSGLRSRCIAAGLERSRHFTWEATAAATLDAYERVARG